jgi:hypothetical protein
MQFLSCLEKIHCTIARIWGKNQTIFFYCQDIGKGMMMGRISKRNKKQYGRKAGDMGIEEWKNRG